MQGRFDHGKTSMLVRILSGVFIVLTTVYGYIMSQRAIKDVLRSTASDRPHSVGSEVNEGGESVNGCARGGINSSSSLLGMKKSMSLSMTTSVEQRDLEQAS